MFKYRVFIVFLLKKYLKFIFLNSVIVNPEITYKPGELKVIFIATECIVLAGNSISQLPHSYSASLFVILVKLLLIFFFVIINVIFLIGKLIVNGLVILNLINICSPTFTLFTVFIK